MQHTLLTAYAALARTGIMRQAWARRAFLAAYSGYKTWIEAGPVDRLREFVPAGSTVVDVGANVGFFTMKFALWVGEQGRVIAVEPDRENFEVLAAKVKKAGLQDRVRLHQAAAAAETGSVRLRRNELHPGDHRISFHPEGIPVPAVTSANGSVAVAPAPAPPAAAAPRSVSLVKIDVQGAEMLVLKGAKRMLDQLHPALFVEVDDRALRHFGSSAEALLEHMQRSGYKTHELVENGPPRELSHHRLFASLKTRSYIDVLFLPGRRLDLASNEYGRSDQRTS